MSWQGAGRSGCEVSIGEARRRGGGRKEPPGRPGRTPARALSAATGSGLLAGLYLLLGGHEAVEPLAAACSLGFYAGTALFAVIALPALWRADNTANAVRHGDALRP